MNVLLIRTTKAGEVLRSLTPYSSYDTALSNFYDALRKAVADSNIVRAVAELINDEGRILKCERWAEQVVTNTEEIEGVNS